MDVIAVLGKVTATIVTLSGILACASPVAGFTVIMPKEDVVFLDLTVEEALPLIISGGVVVPERQLTPEGVEKLKKRTTTVQIEKLKQLIKERRGDAPKDKLYPPGE